MAGKLNVGERVQVGGGYNMEPPWLDGRQYYSGTVKAFIPGQNDMPAVVVVLAEDAVFEDYAGKCLVQNLSHNPPRPRPRRFWFLARRGECDVAVAT
jgi:hypothetical protein